MRKSMRFAPILALAPGFAETTLRFIPQADLRSIDPIWTTAYVSRNFGYLVYDTLFALDKDFKPRPQMVDTWTAVNILVRGSGDKAWFGWPTDPKVEELVDAWFKAPDLAAQKKLAEQIQVAAYSGNIPYVPTGQFVVPTAYRKNVSGLIVALVPFLGDVEKK